MEKVIEMLTEEIVRERKKAHPDVPPFVELAEAHARDKYHKLNDMIYQMYYDKLERCEYEYEESRDKWNAHFNQASETEKTAMKMLLAEWNECKKMRIEKYEF